VQEVKQQWEVQDRDIYILKANPLVMEELEETHMNL